MSVSPVYAVLLGQAGDLDCFSGRLASGPTVLSSCCGYSTDLSVVGGVLIQVFDLQLATSYGHLIPHDCLVTDNLLEKAEREKTREKKQQTNVRHGVHRLLSRLHTVLSVMDLNVQREEGCLCCSAPTDCGNLVDKSGTRSH